MFFFVVIEQRSDAYLACYQRLMDWLQRVRLVSQLEKPEQVLNEEINLLRSELNRKRRLLAGTRERIQSWKNFLTVPLEPPVPEPPSNEPGLTMPISTPTGSVPLASPSGSSIQPPSVSSRIQ